MSPSSRTFATILTMLFSLLGCSNALDPSAGSDAGMTDAANDPPLEPVSSIEAATRGFRLFYSERSHRALVAHNRFGMFGDAEFSVGIDRSGIEKTGTSHEVVVGPKDNNPIGRSIYNAYHVYRAFRTRSAELTLIRMFNGLVFLEGVSGVPGLSVRAAIPGWTVTLDGESQNVLRSRNGAAIDTHPLSGSPALQGEILETFFRDVSITYRENPEEYYFDYMPVARIEKYAVTYSHSALPSFLRSSDCCSSMMRTPAGHQWEGAFWGNHNSRDNLPDLVFGFIAALDASADEDASSDVRDAANRAVESMRRTGDLLVANRFSLMTVDEFSPYGTLAVSGAIRPHGLEENQDLGSAASCASAYLAKAISSDGLSLPIPELTVDVGFDETIAVVGNLLGCSDLAGERTCAALADGFCGSTWAELPESRFLGLPFFQALELLAATNDGLLDGLGGFQNDLEDIADSALGLVLYARATGDAALLGESQATLVGLTNLVREFADLIWESSDPDRHVRQYRKMALLEAMAGLETPHTAALDDFDDSDRALTALEGLLSLDDTSPMPLVTDAEISSRVEAELADLDHPSGRGEVIRDRYADAYGSEPPLRRAGDRYEARRPGGPWQLIDNPRHWQSAPGTLFRAASLCTHSTQIIDCTWASRGCVAADLNKDRVVDADDVGLFEMSYSEGMPCSGANAWCSGLDLDHTGKLDELDIAFMSAAQGCHYSL